MVRSNYAYIYMHVCEPLTCNSSRHLAHTEGGTPPKRMFVLWRSLISSYETKRAHFMSAAKSPLLLRQYYTRTHSRLVFWPLAVKRGNFVARLGVGEGEE